MRIKEKIENIDYNDTKLFFKKRAEKFQESNPYSVTMYQDNNEEIVRQRNKKEIEKLMPLLHMEKEAKVVDVACGIGRWADALPEDIKEYCGMDFSEELVAIANKRNHRNRFFYCVGGANEIAAVLKKNGKGLYNRILIVGILMYLNDVDMADSLRQIEKVCETKSVICIREPIAIEERLTLKDFFSEELNDYYNAIYRTRDELMVSINEMFLNKGFRIKEEGFLFDDDALNNRKETAQYYYILER